MHFFAQMDNGFSILLVFFVKQQSIIFVVCFFLTFLYRITNNMIIKNNDYKM
jgi:lipid-A-disaccharide synthase-like uncharacterized protein